MLNVKFGLSPRQVSKNFLLCKICLIPWKRTSWPVPSKVGKVYVKGENWILCQILFGLFVLLPTCPLCPPLFCLPTRDLTVIVLFLHPLLPLFWTLSCIGVCSLSKLFCRKKNLQIKTWFMYILYESDMNILYKRENKDFDSTFCLF